MRGGKNHVIRSVLRIKVGDKQQATRVYTTYNEVISCAILGRGLVRVRAGAHQTCQEHKPQKGEQRIGGHCQLLLEASLGRGTANVGHRITRRLATLYGE